MKKFILALVLTALASSAIAAVTVSMKQMSAQGVKDVPNNYVIENDYAARTDGQPVYSGQGPWQAATSENVWLIYKITYDGNNQLTVRKTAYGTWDDRASYTYQ